MQQDRTLCKGSVAKRCIRLSFQFYQQLGSDVARHSPQQPKEVIHKILFRVDELRSENLRADLDASQLFVRLTKNCSSLGIHKMVFELVRHSEDRWLKHHLVDSK